MAAAACALFLRADTRVGPYSQNQSGLGYLGSFSLAESRKYEFLILDIVIPIIIGI